MKKWYWIVLFMMLLLLAGCGKESIVSRQGSLALNIDLSSLVNGAQLTNNSGSIAKVTVVLTRANYTNITQNLTIANNIATGQIENLDPGIWHVTAKIYGESDTLLFVGEADADVKAGVSTSVKILFDPVVVDPVTGAITIEVGVNPMPGYKVIDQKINNIMLNEVDNRVYIWDASTNILGVYEADTMNRVKNLTVPQAPLALNFNYDKTGMLLGYPSGQVYLLSFATGQVSLIGDSLTTIERILAYSPDYILISSSGGWNCQLKSMNTHTGQVVSSKDYFYTLSSLVFSPSLQTIYASSTYVSPADLFAIRVNPQTGEMIEIRESIYHGDYSLGEPLRLIKDNSRLVTASGNMFTTSSSAENDLKYAGNIGYAYKDLVCDPASGYLYILNNYNSWYEDYTVRKLIIMNQTNFFIEKTVDLKGNPQHVFSTPSKIIVISENQGTYFSKVFSKTELGF